MSTTNDTYPGTDMLVRICYSADCGKVITELSDVWVDVDSNCSVCTDCRDASRADYDTQLEWELSIIPAARMVGAHLNEIQEG